MIRQGGRSQAKLNDDSRTIRTLELEYDASGGYGLGNTPSPRGGRRPQQAKAYCRAHGVEGGGSRSLAMPTGRGYHGHILAGAPPGGRGASARPAVGQQRRTSQGLIHPRKARPIDTFPALRALAPGVRLGYSFTRPTRWQHETPPQPGLARGPTPLQSLGKVPSGPC